jgi:uncharacterized membrane protein
VKVFAVLGWLVIVVIGIILVLAGLALNWFSFAFSDEPSGAGIIGIVCGAGLLWFAWTTAPFTLSLAWH